MGSGGGVGFNADCVGGSVANSWTDEDLEKLIAFIRADGWLKLIGGPGIHTYPNSSDKREVYLACLELEKRGRVYRKIDEPDHVFWLPVEQPKPGPSETKDAINKT